MALDPARPPALVDVLGDLERRLRIVERSVGANVEQRIADFKTAAAASADLEALKTAIATYL